MAQECELLQQSLLILIIFLKLNSTWRGGFNFSFNSCPNNTDSTNNNRRLGLVDYMK
jgi:hypothetical protein